MKTFLTSVRLPVDYISELKESGIPISSVIITALSRFNLDEAVDIPDTKDTPISKVSVRLPIEYRSYTSSEIRKAVYTYRMSVEPKDYAGEIAELDAYIESLLSDLSSRKYVIE